MLILVLKTKTFFEHSSNYYFKQIVFVWCLTQTMLSFCVSFWLILWMRVSYVTAQTYSIDNLCQADMDSAFSSKEIKAPWIEYIGTNAAFDADWLSSSFDSDETTAYQSMSQSVSTQLALTETSDITTLFITIDASQASTAIDYVTSYDSFDSGCDSSCQTNVKNAMKQELQYVENIKTFEEKMNPLFTKLDTNFQSAISAVGHSLAVNGNQVVYGTKTIGGGSNSPSPFSIGAAMASTLSLGASLASGGLGLTTLPLLWGVGSSWAQLFIDHKNADTGMYLILIYTLQFHKENQLLDVVFFESLNFLTNILSASILLVKLSNWIGPTHTSLNYFYLRVEYMSMRTECTLSAVNPLTQECARLMPFTLFFGTSYFVEHFFVFVFLKYMYTQLHDSYLC